MYDMKGNKVKYADGAIKFGLLTSTGEPSSLSDALDDPKWRKAMEEEYDALLQNKTWHIVPPSSNKNLIDCKWVYLLRNVQMEQLTDIKLT